VEQNSQTPLTTSSAHLRGQWPCPRFLTPTRLPTDLITVVFWGSRGVGTQAYSAAPVWQVLLLGSFPLQSSSQALAMEAFQAWEGPMPIELNIAVIGIGEWAMKEYLPALSKFAKSPFMQHLNLWLIDHSSWNTVASARRDDVATRIWDADPKHPVVWQPHSGGGTVPTFHWQASRGKIDVFLEEVPHLDLRACVPPWYHWNETNVAFVVCRPEYHVPVSRFLEQQCVKCVVVEKPFCITVASQRYYPHFNRPLPNPVVGTRPELSPSEWDSWRGTVFAFDHYFTRLWALADWARVAQSEFKFGPLRRLVFRMREPVQRLLYVWRLFLANTLPPDAPASTKRWPDGAVQDLGVHGIPLMLLFGAAPGPGNIVDTQWIDHATGTLTCIPPAQMSPYFRFIQKGWCDCDGAAFDVDVHVGWYDPGDTGRDHPEPNRHFPAEMDQEEHICDKFFCAEYQNARIWADLAEPFLILVHRKTGRAPDDWQLLYPAIPGVERILAAATTDPVHLMIDAVLSDFYFKAVGLPITVMPVSSIQSAPQRHPRLPTAEEIMDVLDDWDGAYR
jgi:hypothetical protein